MLAFQEDLESPSVSGVEGVQDEVELSNTSAVLAAADKSFVEQTCTPEDRGLTEEPRKEKRFSESDILPASFDSIPQSTLDSMPPHIKQVII